MTLLHAIPVNQIITTASNARRTPPGDQILLTRNEIARLIATLITVISTVPGPATTSGKPVNYGHHDRWLNY